MTTVTRQQSLLHHLPDPKLRISNIKITSRSLFLRKILHIRAKKPLQAKSTPLSHSPRLHLFA
ncbi:hypothetical protein HanRHA438_Chr05g0228161 [Helianthus annuus]|nr:hypothetical protein HanRHA438_Chr05g0228161 [Helianthus annuus]